MDNNITNWAINLPDFDDETSLFETKILGKSSNNSKKDIYSFRVLNLY